MTPHKYYCEEKEALVVSGFAPPVSVHPALRSVRIRIAVVMMMVVLLDCIKIELWCEYLRVVVSRYNHVRWIVGIDCL